MGVVWRPVGNDEHHLCVDGRAVCAIAKSVTWDIRRADGRKVAEAPTRAKAQAEASRLFVEGATA